MNIEELAAKAWYYKVELAPGLFTNGIERGTLAACRDFISRVDLREKRSLDIGCQDFVASVLIHRQSETEEAYWITEPSRFNYVQSIVAYDRLDLTEKYLAVQAAYDVKFHYEKGIPLHELRASLIRKRISPVFDFVNFSGVLYHMIDPLAGLAMARSFVREGGLLLIETSVVFNDEPQLVFNRSGSLYKGSNYFQISVGLLEYWIRLLKMEPIDFAYWGARESDIGRLVVMCRATNTVELPETDEWAREPWIWLDMVSYGVDFASLESSRPPLGYSYADNGHCMAPTLIESIRSRPRYRPDREKQILRLTDHA